MLEPTLAALERFARLSVRRDAGEIAALTQYVFELAAPNLQVHRPDA
jgi:hypothetical protein